MSENPVVWPSEIWHASSAEEPESCWREESLDPDATFWPRGCLEASGSKRAEMEPDVAVEENVSMIPNGSCSCSRLSPDAAEGAGSRLSGLRGPG